MTKTLTEQWHEGTLEEGYYYVFYADQGDHYPSCYTEDYDDIDYWNGCEWHYDDDPVIKVLSPVPSYDEWQAELDSNNELLNVQKRLEKKLAIAAKALKEINVRSQRDWNEYDCMGCARKALYDIEMEGVK